MPGTMEVPPTEPRKGATMEKKELLINPLIRWAVHPADAGRIAYIDGIAGPQSIPKENSVITRPFLVDPQTRQPVPVRVVRVGREFDESRNGHMVVLVVSREQ